MCAYTQYKEELGKRTIGAERRRSVTLSEPCQESRGKLQLSPGTLLFTQVLGMFSMLYFVDKIRFRWRKPVIERSDRKSVCKCFKYTRVPGAAYALNPLIHVLVLLNVLGARTITS